MSKKSKKWIKLKNPKLKKILKKLKQLTKYQLLIFNLYEDTINSDIKF